MQWDQKYCLGHAEIDAQHQELFLYFERFLAACNAGQGKEEVLRVLDFLGQYVVNHFYLEESLMDSLGHPEYEEHCQQHRFFAQRLAQLKAKAADGTHGLVLILATGQLLAGWLREHIDSADRAIVSPSPI